MSSNPSDPQIVPEECALPLSPAKTPPPIPPIPPTPPIQLDEVQENSNLILDIPHHGSNEDVTKHIPNDSPLIRQHSHYDLDEINKSKNNDFWFSKLMADEDFKQKLSMIVTVTIEMYRVIMSSLLVLFVPQSCNNQQCSINEKLSPDTQFEIFVLVSNFFTLFSFAITYLVESRRENILINYLDVNRFKPRDNDSVAKELLQLSNHRLQRIEKYDKIYKYLSYSSMSVFTLNTLFSVIVIFNNFLDSKTITVLLTNMLFMSSKLYDMYSIVNTKDFIFLSAYLTRKIQFNDVDKDKIENRELSVDSQAETPERYVNHSAPPLNKTVENNEC